MFKTMYGQGKEALDPFIKTGTDATNRLQEQMGDLTAPIMMDQTTLEKTPGYDWLKTQGMRGVTNQNVLRGLSGAQMKGAADFVKGLADTTYKTQFDIANTNKTNAFNRLFSTASGGQSAATNLLTTGVSGAVGIGGVGQNNANTMSNNSMAGANAQAGADLATGQQIASMIGGAPYLPFASNKLYPNGMPGVSGMYGGGSQVPIGTTG